MGTRHLLPDKANPTERDSSLAWSYLECGLKAIWYCLKYDYVKLPWAKWTSNFVIKLTLCVNEVEFKISMTLQLLWKHTTIYLNLSSTLKWRVVWKYRQTSNIRRTKSQTLHHRSKVSIQAASENMSTISHEPLLISNHWMEIMLHGYWLLKITYLGIFSMKVCLCKSVIYSTNDQLNYRHWITFFYQVSYFLTITVLK